MKHRSQTIQIIISEVKELEIQTLILLITCLDLTEFDDQLLL